MTKYLVTGTAGFIGFHTIRQLLKEDVEIVGLDNINDYYDQTLKYSRLKEAGIDEASIEYGKLVQSTKYPQYRFIKLNLEDDSQLEKLFEPEKFDKVIHLAAQAGVRYSLKNPKAYIDSNLQGFMNILEGCRHNSIQHLVYASSSSVYGLNKNIPFSTSDNVDHPISLYAASKKANELMAHTYSHLYGLPTSGLRFFTVYGPWGRPDMALFIFTKAIMEDRKIDVFNNGDMQRDFTYVDDIVKGILKVSDNPPAGDQSWNPEVPDPSRSSAPYRIFNIGNNNPVKLMDFITCIEKVIGKKASINFMPIQAGDVPSTYADVSDLMESFNYKPETSIETGINSFIKWYKEYYYAK